MKSVETDVLVIGSGLAGLRAAIEAARNGVRSTVISKSAIGAACNSAIAGGGFAGAVYGLAMEDHIAATLAAGKGLNDRKLVQVLAAKGPREIEALKALGVNFAANRPFGCRIDTGKKTGETRLLGGRLLMMRMTATARAFDRIRFMPHRFIYKILVTDGRASGAIAIEKDGTPSAISSRSIVLATGGGAAIYRRNDNYKGALGDGYALAIDSGLRLSDMEFVQFYPLGFAEPALPQAIIYPPYPEEVRLCDAEGNDLLKKYGHNMSLHQFTTSARDQASLFIYNESLRGSVLLDYTRVPDERWGEYPLSLFPRRFNFREKPFRISPVAHFFMGGIRINVSGETGVPGLFAAGEVTSGVHGANRLGGNALTECLVFGAEGGLAAANYAKGSTSKQASFDATKWPGSLISGKGDPKARDRISTLLKKVRETAWRYAGPVRNETGMRKGLSFLEEAGEELSHIRVGIPADLISKKELEDGLLVIKAVLLSSLARQESVGAFQRDDYPHPGQPG